MIFNFDKTVDRSHTLSSKWRQYDPDVLPMWVADMDYESPPGVITALQNRIEHGVFGYESSPEELKTVIVSWVKERYKWTITEDAIVFLPGVVPGFNWTVRNFLTPSDGLLIQTPVYPPILRSAAVCGVRRLVNPLHKNADGTYIIDFDDFEKQIKDNVKIFMLCNPHNPVGHVYQRDELERMADLCIQQDVMVCSDEIHADLVYSGHHHIPIGSLHPEIADRTITLFAPSKTFNIAGLKCAYAVIPNANLRRQFTQNLGYLLGSVNNIGYTAALAAYKSGAAWLHGLVEYLEGNREILLTYIEKNMPEIRVARPEGTYLAWLDCSALDLKSSPYTFFLEHARVALNDGGAFGPEGADFVRLNFGCSQNMLVDALGRMQTALTKHKL